MLDSKAVLALAYPDTTWLWEAITCALNHVGSEVSKRARRCRQNRQICKDSYKGTWDERAASRENQVLSLILMALFPSQTNKLFATCQSGRNDVTGSSYRGNPEGLRNGNIPLVGVYNRGEMALKNFTFTDVLHIRHSFGLYRFVTCGTKGTDRFKFYEFINAYDKYVWSTFIISSVVLSAALFIAQSNKLRAQESGFRLVEHIVRGGMPILKGALEQGDPFSAYFLKASKLRWIVACYLCAALVLSNGYKNCHNKKVGV